MINVFSQRVRLGLVDTCLPSGYYRMFVFFSLPYKQRGDIFYKLEFKCNTQSLGKNMLYEHKRRRVKKKENLLP